MAKGRDLAKMLRKHNRSWKDSEARARGASILPPGEYQFEIGPVKDRAVVVEDSDGAVRARIMLTTVAGPENTEGRKTTKSYTLINSDGEPDEMGLSILKSELTVLDVECDELDLSDVGEALEALFGAVVSAAAVNKERDDGSTRQNIYLNGLEKAASSRSKKKSRGRR